MPPDVDSLLPLREVIGQYRLSAAKAFGQHFLLDMNITRKIARLAGIVAGDTVIEIGPGPGGLTRALLESEAGQVIAVEKDTRFLEALAPLQALYGERFQLLQGDALDIPLHRLGDGAAPRKVVANLPYNVGTLLLLAMLKQGHAFASLTLMFQKEVAERLVAQPGSDAYGRLGVFTQAVASVRLLFNLPASAFVPPPKVASSVVQLLPASLDEDFPLASLERLTTAAFGQRRKMLRSSLKNLSPQILVMLDSMNISPSARAEEISVAQYVALAYLLHKDTIHPR